MIKNKQAVINRIAKAGEVSSQFYILTLVAAAIAISGLLLNDSSYIIGSMLISPLGGSIGLLGLFLATLDMRLLKQAAECLSMGIIFVLLVSFLITFFFPVNAITPEILLRTRPVIYDLLISIIAGGALGYILVQEHFHKNVGVIIGVGIATSVLPPLATIGYGFAIPDYRVAFGAFILFFTNVCAIAIGSSITFRHLGIMSKKRWHYIALVTLLVVLVLVLLYLYH